ncbi:MAG: alpha/beta hydrolase [Burkholderiaceae bacterium]
MRAFATVVSGNASLSTEVVGSGHPVVFLHANVCDKRMWRAQLDAIGVAHQAIAYDRRGFGHTRSDEEGYSAISDLFAVIEATAGDTPVVLVGCSQGARIALDAAFMHPSRIVGLVLISPTVSGAPDAVYSPQLLELIEHQKNVEASGDADELNALKARLFLDGPLAESGRVAGDSRRLFLDMNAIALRSSSRRATDRDAGNAFSRLADLRIPCQVIWGTFDFPHIQERARMVAQMVSKGRGHEIAGAAHLPSLEQPEVVNDLILDLAKRSFACPAERRELQR